MIPPAIVTGGRIEAGSFWVVCQTLPSYRYRVRLGDNTLNDCGGDRMEGVE